MDNNKPMKDICMKCLEEFNREDMVDIIEEIDDTPIWLYFCKECYEGKDFFEWLNKNIW